MSTPPWSLPLLAPVALAAALLAPAPAAAQSCTAPGNALCEGDVLVVDLTADRVIRVDPDDGTQELVVEGDLIVFPRSVTSDRNGRLFVSIDDGVVRADPETAVMHRTFQGSLPVPPRGIDTPQRTDQPPGNLFLAFPGLTNVPEVLLVEPVSGLSASIGGPGLGFPLGLVMDPRNQAEGVQRVLIADAGNTLVLPDPVPPQVALVDTDMLATTVLAQGGFLATPYRIAADGDDIVYVTDLGGLSQMGTRDPQVVRIDRSIPFDPGDPTANQTVVAEGGLLTTPIGIAVLDSDTLLVSDADALGGAVLEIDLTAMTPVAVELSSGQLFDNPWEIRIVGPIDPLLPRPLFVTDAGGADGNGVFRLDPDGTKTPIATGPPFVRPTGIAVDPDDTDFLVVADSGGGAVLRVNKAPGSTPTVVSAGGLLTEPTGVVVDADGDYLVSDRALPGVVRVDPGSGVQSLVTQGNQLIEPSGISIEPSGRLLLTDPSGDGRLVEVNPFTPPGFVRQQDCVFEGAIAALNGVVSLQGAAGLVADANDSTLFSLGSTSPVARFAPGAAAFLVETTSTQYQDPRQLAVEESRAILTADGGSGAGDGRLLRLDPVEDEPTVVLGSDFHDPVGVAVDGLVLPRPPFTDIDTDGDGINDLDDNCIEWPNAGQADSDLDGIGDACEGGTSCDANGDEVVGIPDFVLWRQQVGADCSVVPCTADCDGDGVVGIPDFNIWKRETRQQGVDGPAGELSKLDPRCNCDFIDNPECPPLGP